MEYTVIVDEFGTRWFHGGKRHRIGGPAFEYLNGDKEWYFEGELHREDGPAVEHNNGYKAWFINGQWHRIDGPAIIYASGNTSWYRFGKLHRIDGPAVELKSGCKAWYVDGLRHREDGPACEYAHGTHEWWLNGKQYTEVEFLTITKNSTVDSGITKYIPKYGESLIQACSVATELAYTTQEEVELHFNGVVVPILPLLSKEFVEARQHLPWIAIASEFIGEVMAEHYTRAWKKK